VCDSHALPFYPDANTRHRNAQRTPNGKDFFEGGQRRREIFRGSSSAVQTYIPAKAFIIGTSGRGAGWKIFSGIQGAVFFVYRDELLVSGRTKSFRAYRVSDFLLEKASSFEKIFFFLD
jgi:hypothetical protein